MLKLDPTSLEPCWPLLRQVCLPAQPLLAVVGRGRALTPTGHELAGHARRILDVHTQAMLSLKGARAGGQVANAATQDFADSALPVLLSLCPARGALVWFWPC